MRKDRIRQVEVKWGSDRDRSMGGLGLGRGQMVAGTT